MNRGDIFTTPGGGRGIYVGTTPHGAEWVAYEPDDFATMCQVFDELYGGAT